MAFTSRVHGGKWKARIVWALVREQPQRFSALRRACPPVSDRTLTKRLRELEEWGVNLSPRVSGDSAKDGIQPDRTGRHAPPRNGGNGGLGARQSSCDQQCSGLENKPFGWVLVSRILVSNQLELASGMKQAWQPASRARQSRLLRPAAHLHLVESPASAVADWPWPRCFVPCWTASACRNPNEHRPYDGGTGRRSRRSSNRGRGHRASTARPVGFRV